MKILQIVYIMATGGYIERREYRKKTKYILFNRRKLRRACVSGEQIEELYKRGVLNEEPIASTHRRWWKRTSCILTIQNVRRVSGRRFHVAEPEQEANKSTADDFDIAASRVLKKMGVDPSKQPHWMPEYYRGRADGYLCSYCGKKSWSKKEKCDGCNSIMM